MRMSRTAGTPRSSTLVGEQAGGQRRQGGVLGAAGADGAGEAAGTEDAEPVHRDLQRRVKAHHPRHAGIVVDDFGDGEAGGGGAVADGGELAAADLQQQRTPAGQARRPFYQIAEHAFAAAGREQRAAGSKATTSGDSAGASPGST